MGQIYRTCDVFRCNWRDNWWLLLRWYKVCYAQEIGFTNGGVYKCYARLYQFCRGLVREFMFLVFKLWREPRNDHSIRMLQSGWRSWPEGYLRDEVYRIHSSSAHTIIVFTFFNAALLTGLFYLSVMSYNEGYYYLYHRVQQGKPRQFLVYQRVFNSLITRFAKILIVINLY